MPKAVNYLSLIQQQHSFRLHVFVLEQKPIMGRKLGRYGVQGNFKHRALTKFQSFKENLT